MSFHAYAGPILCDPINLRNEAALQMADSLDRSESGWNYGMELAKRVGMNPNGLGRGEGCKRREN